jgi:hypothetical protein
MVIKLQLRYLMLLNRWQVLATPGKRHQTALEACPVAP